MNTNSYDENDLRWLGGLLDAKGAFTAEERNGRARPIFYLNTVNHDLLVEMKQVLGFGSINPRNAGRKKTQQFRFEVSGLSEFVSLENMVARFMRTSKRNQFAAKRLCARVINEPLYAKYVELHPSVSTS